MLNGLEQVIEIISQNIGHRPIVVPSALKGVTDQLIGLSDYCFEQIRQVLEKRIMRTGTAIKKEADTQNVEFSLDTYARGFNIADAYVAAAKRIGVNPAAIDNIIWSKDNGNVFPVGLKKVIMEYLIQYDRYILRFYMNAFRRAARELDVDAAAFNAKSTSDRLDAKASEIVMEEVRLYMRDKFAFWGEFSSSLLLKHAFRNFGKKVFAKEPSNLGLLTEMTPGGAIVIQESSPTIRNRITAAARKQYDLYVLGGFISKGIMPADTYRPTRELVMYRTTLGRGGSDLTAVIFGGALNIPVFLYSDTDGVLDAHPKLVEGKSIPQLSREEALEFARFGSKILYDVSMQHALEHKVEVYSMNTFRPSHPGTFISGTVVNSGKPKGISILEDGNNYVVAVVGHEIGNNQNEIARLKELMNSFLVICSKNNQHSITFTLHKDVVNANAHRMYENIMRT